MQQLSFRFPELDSKVEWWAFWDYAFIKHYQQEDEIEIFPSFFCRDCHKDVFIELSIVPKKVKGYSYHNGAEHHNYTFYLSDPLPLETWLYDEADKFPGIDWGVPECYKCHKLIPRELLYG